MKLLTVGFVAFENERYVVFVVDCNQYKSYVLVRVVVFSWDCVLSLIHI